MVDLSVLEVLLHNESIGTLTRVGGDRVLFAFNDRYIGEQQRPVLGLSFKDSFGQLITEFKTTQARLMPFFSNMLPEGHMRSYLAQRAGVNPTREFFMLWVLGMDLPGAITIVPAGDGPWPVDTANAEHESRDVDREQALRFSLAGVQMKFSAIAQARGGLTIPARGIGGSWIVKLPSREFGGVPENEFSMMTLANLVGINVPTVKLVDVDAIENLPQGMSSMQGKALVVERFDRPSGAPSVHMEDFAQIFGVYPDDKYRKGNYRSIAKVIGAETSRSDIAEFSRRLTFNNLIGNADMHLKNWSLIYPDRRHARLSPAYDLVSTIAYIPDATAALNFSRTKRFDEFSTDELVHLAAKAMLPEKAVLEAAHETVELFHQHWQTEKNNLPLNHTIVETIEAHIKTIPIAKGACHPLV